MPVWRIHFACLQSNIADFKGFSNRKCYVNIIINCKIFIVLNTVHSASVPKVTLKLVSLYPMNLKMYYFQLCLGLLLHQMKFFLEKLGNIYFKNKCKEF